MYVHMLCMCIYILSVFCRFVYVFMHVHGDSTKYLHMNECMCNVYEYLHITFAYEIVSSDVNNVPLKAIFCSPLIAGDLKRKPTALKKAKQIAAAEANAIQTHYRLITRPHMSEDGSDTIR